MPRELIQRRITLGAVVLLAAALIACNGEEDANEVAAGSVAGIDIPMFRGGPARTGEHPGPGPEGSPAVLWRFKTEGPIFASPAVVDGVVYVGVRQGGDERDHHLYAIDAGTGEERWRFEAYGDYAGGLSSPAVVGGIVYAASPFSDEEGVTGLGFLYAVDAETKAIRWRFQAEGAVPSSPAVVDGVVYIGSGVEDGESGYLYAVDADTGEERWRLKSPGPVWSSPAVVGDVVYFGSDAGDGESGYLYAIDAGTGAIRWQFQAEGRVRSSPAVVDGVVYFGSAVCRPSVEEKEAGICIVLFDDAAGYLYAVDAESGQQRWRFETRGSVHSSPTVADGVVYFGSGIGEDAAYFREDPTIAVGGRLYAVDTKSGEERWNFELSSPIFSSPAVVDGVVYFGTIGLQVLDIPGYLYAIASVNDVPEPTPVTPRTSPQASDLLWRFADEPPFSDPRVATALAALVDHQAVAEAAGLWPDTQLFPSDASIFEFTQLPDAEAQARRMLAEAGSLITGSLR